MVRLAMINLLTMNGNVVFPIYTHLVTWSIKTKYWVGTTATLIIHTDLMDTVILKFPLRIWGGKLPKSII